MLVVKAKSKRTQSWKSVYIDQNDFSIMIEKLFDQSTHWKTLQSVTTLQLGSYNDHTTGPYGMP